MDSTPDTGCTITLLNLDLALRNGIHIDRTKKIELYHAAGGSMHVEGMANIRVCGNNIQATLRVAVSSFPIPRDAVTNGNGDTTTVSRCTNFDTF